MASVITALPRHVKRWALAELPFTDGYKKVYSRNCGRTGEDGDCLLRVTCIGFRQKSEE